MVIGVIPQSSGAILRMDGLEFKYVCGAVLSLRLVNTWDDLFV